MRLLLGYDLGSSFVKASLINAETGELVASASAPDIEMKIEAKETGWAEQSPDMWWENIKALTEGLKSEAQFDPADISAIGISYQMHGLVVVDEAQNVLRPAIIWCDSRAVGIGDAAADDIGADTCLKKSLNLPGNFTASKLKWVKENEPDIYSRIHKMMLPGDFIAMKMTGKIKTTPAGLSEGIMWDFDDEKIASYLLDYYGVSDDLIPERVQTFSEQGELSDEGAKELGLNPGTIVSYRGGDQPNNALSLNVLEPGEIAVTAGTSGVVYGVNDKAAYDPASRVNVFMHVNHAREKRRLGVLLCLNGTGILNSWLKKNISGPNESYSYKEMDALALTVPAGSEGLLIYPYGNGAERTLKNRNPGASVKGWNFNVHTKAHFMRAAQEGIVYALNYGVEIMCEMGMEIKTVRAGHANMFLSELFAKTFASLTDAVVELYNTDGAQGAARGAGIGVGIYKSAEGAFAKLKVVKTVEPDKEMSKVCKSAYAVWKKGLNK